SCRCIRDQQKGKRVNQPVRTLLVGVGARGKIWSRLLHDEATTEVVGYVDLDQTNLDWAKRHYAVAANGYYTDMRVALSELKPDFVLLATPPMDRYREVITVFEHGAHL